MQRQNWVDSGPPCLLLPLVLVVPVVLVPRVVLLAGVAGPAVGLEVQAAGLAVVAGLLPLEAVAVPG